MESSPIVRFSNVSKLYASGDVLALEDINLDVRRGEFVAIVGPSGCGKSTLLNMIAGLSRPSGGTIEFDGSPIRGPNTNAGYITQHSTVLPWRTARKNVLLPLEFRGVDRRRAEKLAMQALDLVGLKGFENRRPHELSGGMVQRLAIARTLVYEPSTYLLDEPFGSLDAQLRTVMHEEFLRIWQTSGGTVVFVTHDLNEALVLADRVVVISRRPGRIKAVVDVDLPRPRDVIGVQSTPEFRLRLEELWGLLDRPEAHTP
jgi:NitT/TauT family transport system ATP-binding protein